MIVIIASDTVARRDAAQLADCLAALSRQTAARQFEVIVPYAPPVLGLDAVQARFSHVRFMPVLDLECAPNTGPTREHHDELRARAVPQAQADIVALLEDHDRPEPDWAQQVVTAHQGRYVTYAGVGGAVENAIDHPLNWAVYFCDFGRYQNPVPEGPSQSITDVNASYKRSALQVVEAMWRARFHETNVNAALMERGHRLALTREIVVQQHRPTLTLGTAVQERFIWGRSYGAGRCKLLPRWKLAVYIALAPMLPVVLVWRMTRVALSRKRLIREFARALPLTGLLTVAWCAGEAVGYLTGRAGPAWRPAKGLAVA